MIRNKVRCQKKHQANFCELCRWLTHGSWSLLWPFQLLVLRIQKWRMPWRTFWRRHVYIVRSTAQMVMSGDSHLTSKEAHRSPFPYILKKTAIVTTFLTVAGSSWYLAVGWTTGSDLTAIYNCSTFFAYAFSVPLLGDKLRLDKIMSVVVAFAGVLIIAYGDSKSGDEGNPADKADHRTAGNIVIGVGSVLYGLYEVLYKKLACPPEGVSPGRGVIFANTFGSCIGLFTLLVLWFPLPILHFTGLEIFEFPTGPQSYLLAISTLSNASMYPIPPFRSAYSHTIQSSPDPSSSSSPSPRPSCPPSPHCKLLCPFLPLSSILTGLHRSLTIFLVAITEGIRTGEHLSAAAIIGGLMIIIAFFVLAWSSYREMDEERRKKTEDDVGESDLDDDEEEDDEEGETRERED